MAQANTPVPTMAVGQRGEPTTGPAVPPDAQAGGASKALGLFAMFVQGLMLLLGSRTRDATEESGPQRPTDRDAARRRARSLLELASPEAYALGEGWPFYLGRPTQRTRVYMAEQGRRFDPNPPPQQGHASGTGPQQQHHHQAPAQPGPTDAPAFPKRDELPARGELGSTERLRWRIAAAQQLADGKTGPEQKAAQDSVRKLEQKLADRLDPKGAAARIAKEQQAQRDQAAKDQGAVTSREAKGPPSRSTPGAQPTKTEAQARQATQPAAGTAPAGKRSAMGQVQAQGIGPKGQQATPAQMQLPARAASLQAQQQRPGHQQGPVAPRPGMSAPPQRQGAAPPAAPTAAPRAAPVAARPAFAGPGL